MKKFLLCLLVCLCVEITFASDYPPNYAMSRECQYNGPFEVCAVNRLFPNNYPRVTISYTGYLANENPNLNLKFYASSRATGETLILSVPKTFKGRANYTVAAANSYRCVPRPFGTDASTHLPVLDGQYQYCARTVQSTVQPSGHVWETSLPSTEEVKFVDDIFSHALGNFELAAFSETNPHSAKWDSDFGSNYNF